MTMGIEAELRAWVEREERRSEAIMRVLPYFLLAPSALFSLLQPIWGGPVNVAAVILLTVVATAWLYFFHTRHPEWHREPAVMGLYFVGLMLMAGGLVAVSPWYGFFTFIGYVHAYAYLPGRWRYAGVTATATIAAAAYLGGLQGLVEGGTWLAWPVLAVVIALVAGVFIHFAVVDDRRTERQKISLDELHAANTRLEEALQDNAALHAQLLVQAREAGVQDERQRMAREIHDTLAQGLAGILTQLQAAEPGLADGSTQRRQVTTAMDLARQSLAEARRTVHAVEPQVLAEARLPEAIQGAVTRWSEEHGVESLLTITGDPRPLHADVEVTLLRAAQEALANVAKHARARRVVLTLSYMEDVATLDVRDDGVGFDPGDGPTRGPGTRSGGFGLTGMRQRVQRLSGRLVVESEPGGGTAVSATVPAIPAGSEAA